MHRKKDRNRKSHTYYVVTWVAGFIMYFIFVFVDAASISKCT